MPNSSTILCPEDICKSLNEGKGCVEPLPDWWNSSTATSCPLVVDNPNFQACLSGTVYAQVRECNDTTVANVIDIDDDWLVDIHLEVLGDFIDCFCGFWCISVCLESMCADNYYRFPQNSTSPPGYCCCLVEFIPGQTTYDIRICIPANTVDENVCGSAYEPTVIVTVLCAKVIKPSLPDGDPGKYKPAGIATSCELPLMTFYDDENV
jgi:hypothetical protein